MGWGQGLLWEKLLQKKRIQPGQEEWGTHVSSHVMTIIPYWGMVTVSQAQRFVYVTSLILLTTHGADSIFRPGPVKRKPRHRDVKLVAQGHTAGKWQSQAQIQAVMARVCALDHCFLFLGTLVS